MLKIFSSFKKGLSLSINFKYLVGWKKPSALEREDETDSWLEKDSLPGFERLSSPFKGCPRRWQRILHCICLWSGDRWGCPEPFSSAKIYISVSHTESVLFMTQKNYRSNFFIFLPLPSFNSETFFSVDFMNSCPTPGANWKNPTGQFQHREDCCSSNRTPFRPEFRS